MRVLEFDQVVAVVPSEVVKSGNGAVAKALKKYIGHKCIIIIQDGKE